MSKNEKMLSHDARWKLAQRRARLGRLLELDAPDIILWHEMRLVQKSQREVHGRGWNRTSIWSKVRAWWKYTVRAKATWRQWDREDAEVGS